MANTATAFPTPTAKPDHSAIEHSILELWEKQRVFERLRARNRGGKKFSFIDGPITANNPMGVHHAWGRTLKDIYQRLYGLKGYDQRYQNGFDCQGLWVEVGVEQLLNLNSKKEIEEYGLDRFSKACRDRVAEFGEVQTRQSIRLGQWMDWDNDYYTLSDTNISYIWTFLDKCHSNGWLYVGHRPMVWCSRCGTSLSQHELIDNYSDVTHPSLIVRFPLIDDDGKELDESVAIWTTTPWTLPANVAAAVRADSEYVLVNCDDGDNIWVAAARVEDLFGEGAVTVSSCRGSDLVGRRYKGVFSHLTATEGTPYRVVAWDEVSMEDGTGIVHIAPGCGAEDFELGRAEGLPAIAPVDEGGVFVDGFGDLTGITTFDAAKIVINDLKQRGLMVRDSQITHRYPNCWRCGTELIFRLVDEWFIACDEIRETMIEANRTVSWEPDFYGKRMEDWLRNMGDWCISRKRYWGLPLPFYHDPEDPDFPVYVVKSKEHLREVAVNPDLVDSLPELHRPWIDDIEVRHPETGRVLKRITEVGDCWLDAGIIPFSTLGWNNDEHMAGGYATGASAGLSGADLPSHDEWEEWFPCDLVIEMREQIRLWFYSLLFMSVVLDGRAPYKRVLAYEKVNDETGRPMHKSWGNAIWFDDAVEEMSADVMRWQYAQQTPINNLNFGYGPAREIKRRFLTLWNVYSFFTTYANVDGWTPPSSVFNGEGEVQFDSSAFSHRLDQWLADRTKQLIVDVNAAFDRWDAPAYTRAIEKYVDELSNWYVRRSRRRFWKAENGVEDRDEAYLALWSSLVTVSRLLAPVMPFLAEELWQKLYVSMGGAPDSVHLVKWLQVADGAGEASTLIDEVSTVQRVVGLGRAARSAAKIKLRQPLRELVVFRRDTRGHGAGSVEKLIAPWLNDILAELSVKSVVVVDDPAGRWSEGLMPLLPKLGPKYGKDVASIRKAVSEGKVTLLEDGRAQVGDFILESDEYEHRSQSGEGFAVAEDHDWVVAVTTNLDHDLVLEGLSREIIRALQQLRKDSGMEVSDRIAVTWTADGDLREAFSAHSEAICEEVLAVDCREEENDGQMMQIAGQELKMMIRKA